MDLNLKLLGYIPLFTLLILLTVATLIGNTLVVIAVHRFPRLSSQFCFHILSGLAWADICVALFVMPWSMIYWALDQWPFGDSLCKIWMSFDITCCTASILHLCLVALDRYIAIVYPLRYPSIVNRKRIRISILFIWFTSAAISFVPIHLDWYRKQDHNSNSSDLTDCTLPPFAENLNKTKLPRCELDVNPLYGLISSSTSFYVPLLIFCVLYGRILYIAHHQARQVRRITITSTTDKPKLTSDEKSQKKLKLITIISPSNRTVPVNSDLEKKAVADDPEHESSNPHMPNFQDPSNCIPNSTSNSNREDGLNKPEESNCKLRRTEVKAIKTIGLLITFFIASWLPYFLAYIILPFCGKSCPYPDNLLTIITWFGYANSAINPILYGFLQREFREAFTRLVRNCLTDLNLDAKLFVRDPRKLEKYGGESEYLNMAASLHTGP